MMNDRVISTERGIFIFDRMQTMWTSCDNSLRLHFIQYFNIGRGQAKEDIFPSRAASGITRALLILSEHREINFCGVQYLCKSLRDLLGAGIGRGGAPDPPKNFGLGIRFNRRNIESRRPFHSVRL